MDRDLRGISEETVHRDYSFVGIGFSSRGGVRIKRYSRLESF